MATPTNTTAADADQWITVKPNGAEHKGAHVKIDGESGEVKAGMGGKFNGEKISEARKDFTGPRGGNRHASISPFPTAGVAESAGKAPVPPAKPLTEGQRNALAKHEGAWKSYRDANPGKGRADYKDAARSGELDHLQEVATKVDAENAAAEKERKAKKNQAWLERNLPHVAAAKANQQDHAEHAAQPSQAHEVIAPEKTQNIKSGHQEMKEYRKVLKETDKGVAIANRAFERAQALIDHGGKFELAKRGSQEEQNAYARNERYRWLPKSAVSIEQGHVVGVDPWVQREHGFSVVETDADKQAKAERTYLNVPYEQKDKAKAAGAKWDSEKKKWFHPGGELPEALKSFAGQKPSPQVPSMAPTYSGAQSSNQPVSGNSRGVLYPSGRGPQPGVARNVGGKWIVSEPTGKRKRIDENDPSINGHHLLGYEGEYGEYYSNRQATEDEIKKAMASQSSEDQPKRDRHWSYSDEAVQRALMGSDGLTFVAEDGSDDPENYDSRICGAGIAFVSPQGRILFLKRSGSGDHAGEWGLPGGTAEDGEVPEQTATRESREEIGSMPYGERRLLAELISDEGVHFTTYGQPISHEFTPKLNGEHTEHVWADPKEAPQPLHPGVNAALKTGGIAQDMAMDRAMNAAPSDRLAFDRASVRTVDQDGRLHIEITNISKANVCGYLGSEIPDGEALGLDPNRVYQLLRAPEELAAAVKTFNNIPLLKKHVRVSADEPQQSLVVGSTGTDAEFVAPYLRNSLVVWTADAIAGIDNDEQRELSCAYWYRADMTPGTFEGTPYDGVMRDLRGNHIALVGVGRAGPDCLVGDSQLEESSDMKSKPLSRRATLAKGALLGSVKPKLAADSQLDLNKLLEGVTAANWLNKKPGIVAAIKPKLAKDADIADVVKLLDGLDGEPDSDDEKEILDAVDADPAEELLALLRGKLTDEDLESFGGKLREKLSPKTAEDEPAAIGAGAESDKPTDATPANVEALGGEKVSVSKTAMDAAIKAAAASAEQSAVKRMRDIAEAEEAVRPYVGKLVAQDSAEAVYSAALKALGVDITDVHPSAYRHVLQAQPKPGEQRRVKVAQDAAPGADFNARFPGLAGLKSI